MPRQHWVSSMTSVSLVEFEVMFVCCGLSEMCLFTNFLENLHEYLTESRCVRGNIIRKHSKKLEELGDISFPLNAANWIQFVDSMKLNAKSTIFDTMSHGHSLETQILSLLEKSNTWCLSFRGGLYKIKEHNEMKNIHLYLNRPQTIDLCIKEVLQQGTTYGFADKCFQENILVALDSGIESDIEKMTLTELRASITQNVAATLTNCLIATNTKSTVNVTIALNCKENIASIMSGPVLNESGMKDFTTTIQELHKKRSLDMELMARHKYGIQMKPEWGDYFDKIGKASVVLEMLQNRCHKPIKVSLNNLQFANKGPSFIFYNNARISTLLKEFDKRVSLKIYPDLPPIEDIDFTLLIQHEEWEMAYVYIIQFPLLIRNCVCDIKSGILNIHNLVLFLSNLSSIFSVYYRRVKILTRRKEHLLPVLYARIYLLKAVQQVFHNVLFVLSIKPVDKM